MKIFSISKDESICVSWFMVGKVDNRAIAQDMAYRAKLKQDFSIFDIWVVVHFAAMLFVNFST